MSQTARQEGGRWSGLIAGVCLALLAAAPTAVASGRAERDAAAAKKCTKAFVGGRSVCLRKGDKCKKRFQNDYVSVGLSCRKGRLRKPTIEDRRGVEPVLIGKDGQLSLKTALAAFDTGVADLPGVKPKPGEIGDLGDGSLVFNVIQTNMGKLTKAQRAVVQQVTTPAPDALEIPVDDEAAARIGRADLARAARAAPRRRAGGDISITGGTVNEQIDALEHLRNARTVLQKHGFLLLRPLKVSFLTTNVKIKGQLVSAYVPWDDVPPGTSQTCNIFVTKLGREGSPSFQEFVYAHELSHCAQHGFYTSQTAAGPAPDWVLEGGADWMGAMVVAELGDPVDGAEWDAWLHAPGGDLFNRSYSGVGFFAMIEQAVPGNGWQRIRDTYFASSGGSQAAFARATAGLPEIFWTRWGPGLVRNAGLGPEWNYDGPGIPSPKPEKLKLANGRTFRLDTQARGSDGVVLNVTADVLTLDTSKSTKGVMNTEGATRKLAKGAYCAKPGGCKCQTQTNLQLPKVGSTAAVGWGDPFKSRSVTFRGMKLKDYCNRPKPGPGVPGSCTTTPTARAHAREDGESCPVPGPGIMIFDKSETQVASFRIGDCTAGPGGFTAISSDGAWRLEVGFQGFAGFDQEYEIPYPTGGSDPEVVIDGPGGPYGNLLWEPGGLPFAGAIAFPDGDRHGMGLGFIAFGTAAGEEGPMIRGAGGMTCVYPDD